MPPRRAGVGGEERPERPASSGGPHPSRQAQGRNACGAAGRLADRRGGPRRKRRPHPLFGKAHQQRCGHAATAGAGEAGHPPCDRHLRPRPARGSVRRRSWSIERGAARRAAGLRCPQILDEVLSDGREIMIRAMTGKGLCSWPRTVTANAAYASYTARRVHWLDLPGDSGGSVKARRLPGAGRTLPLAT
jgi:hypothetical protein